MLIAQLDIWQKSLLRMITRFMGSRSILRRLMKQKVLKDVIAADIENLGELP